MKTIIVTGSSRGIGREVCINLAERGHKVLAVSRRIDKLESIQTTSLHNLIPVELDVSQLSKNWLEKILHHSNKIDALVNNAAVLINKPFKETTINDWKYIFEVNLFSVVNLIQGLLPHFTKPAHIVNISSMGGFQGSVKFAGLSAYSASKAALTNLTECLAEELKYESIYCNALALGAVQTEMLQEAFPNYTAPVTPTIMADYIVHFILHGHEVMNGKVLPLSINTP
ncbi:MAG: SDR family oxidoreductase [Bacteroidia bacterium]|nr:SDR family oxidoreductase [Bacteroidia bacterium]MDW8348211.1 SDR family oxidoreductase [Bacteroidia bacterium]